MKRKSSGLAGYYRRSGGGGSPASLLNHGVHRVSRHSTFADPVIDAVELESDRVTLGLGCVRTNVFNGGAIATRTGLGDNHAIKRLMHGANLGKTNFESHDGCFTERCLLGKAEDNTVAPLACQAPTPITFPSQPHFLCDHSPILFAYNPDTDVRRRASASSGNRQSGSAKQRCQKRKHQTFVLQVERTQINSRPSAHV